MFEETHDIIINIMEFKDKWNTHDVINVAKEMKTQKCSGNGVGNEKAYVCFVHKNLNKLGMFVTLTLSKFGKATQAQSPVAPQPSPTTPPI